MPHDHQRIIAGAMSGTSADGVDVALARIAGRGTAMTAQLIAHHHHPYDAATRNEIFAFRGGDAHADLARLAQLGRTISLTYAVAVNEALAAAGLSASDLAAVAAHGQTLYHAPPNTIQWFDPALVAADVGCAVVSDFRRADLAAGGQGAPLVPYADYVLFRHETENRVLLNIGGIANLTWLRAGGALNDVIAFDTGPGNCISDHLCRKHFPDGPGYDVGGRAAVRGKVHTALAARVMTQAYFRAPAPKSTDGPQMIALFEAAMDDLELRGVLTLHDQLATAAFITTSTIMFAIAGLGKPDLIIASGGGIENEAIVQGLSSSIVRVGSTENFGVPPAAKEALAFALLAAATLDGEPSNVPSVTGANRSVVLGSITPKP